MWEGRFTQPTFDAPHPSARRASPLRFVDWPWVVVAVVLVAFWGAVAVLLGSML